MGEEEGLMSALFCDITQRIVSIPYRRFGTTYRSHHDPWRWDPIGCIETSVRNYHYTLHNVPEEHRSRLLRGGSLKSHKEYQSKYEIWSTLEQFRDNKISFQLPRKYLLWKRVYWAFNRYAGFIWLSFKAFFAQINAVQPTARHAREADEMRAATSEGLSLCELSLLLLADVK
jgi:hypothetical protein